MVIVTDKNFYMNHNLKELLDLCKKREEKKWDNCIIIDGKERAGKSTLAKIIGYYYASITNKKFSVDNIYFDPVKLRNDARNTKNQIFVWDEAAIGGEAISWQNKEIQQLNRIMQTCGKYQHFYIFIIPQFHRLHRYLAVERSIALLHVYSPDMLKRGDYLCLNEQQKTWVYNKNKISESYGSNWSFNASWAMKNTENLIDEEAYEKKKDEAIAMLDKAKDKVSKNDIKLVELQNKIVEALGIDKTKEVLKLSHMTIYNWINKYKEYQDMGILKSKKV